MRQVYLVLTMIEFETKTVPRSPRLLGDTDDLRKRKASRRLNATVRFWGTSCMKNLGVGIWYYVKFYVIVMFFLQWLGAQSSSPSLG